MPTKEKQEITKTDLTRDQKILIKIFDKLETDEDHTDFLGIIDDLISNKEYCDDFGSVFGKTKKFKKILNNVNKE